jgi:hypothetical protein
MNNFFIIYETYINGHKPDILDILSLLAILCVYFAIISVFCFLSIYSKNIQLTYNKLKKINIKYPRLALIKLGFYYGMKIDIHYYANLIVKICKKHLDLKEITAGHVMSDLYSSTKFGRLYHYRNIKGFINRNILFSLIRKTH